MAIPGPGEYNIDRKNCQKAIPGPTSSFLCSRRPLPLGTNALTPAPGAYELARAQQGKVDKDGVVLKHPFFRSRTKRDPLFIPSSEVPGPGEYDVGRGLSTAKETTMERRAMAMKHAGAGSGGSTGRSKDDDFITPGELLGGFLHFDRSTSAWNPRNMNPSYAGTCVMHVRLLEFISPF